MENGGTGLVSVIFHRGCISDIHAMSCTGTAPLEAEETFKITVQPEKEIVMILVPQEIKDKVLRSIYDSAGLASEAQGIAFSLPIERAIGLSSFSPEAKDKEA